MFSHAVFLIKVGDRLYRAREREGEREKAQKEKGSGRAGLNFH